MIIHPNSLSVEQLLGSVGEQYVIPAYQRRYSWGERQIRELIDDVRLLDDNDTHLLGSIVCLAGAHRAGLNRLELVDGQQRLTTISIVLHCIRERLLDVNDGASATDMGRLLETRPLNAPALPKIALDSMDAKDFTSLVAKAPDYSAENWQLAQAFSIVRDWASQSSDDDLRRFMYRLRNQAMVIRLDVSNAKDAFKLFETINNRGLRLSPTDIVKNFLLGNAARFSPAALEHARTAWSELIRHLDGTDSDNFLRYYVMSILGTRVTASELVWVFKKLFMDTVSEARELPERHVYADADAESEDEEDCDGASAALEDVASEVPAVPFVDFMARLVGCARVFAEIALAKTGEAKLDRHLRNLQMIRASQTYGFLMHLRTGECDAQKLAKVLRMTESLVLRRHVCKQRANETEALFARLCGTVSAADPVDATREAYRELSPDDAFFEKAFAAADFGANLMDRARYCLEQFELASRGAHDELNVLGAADVHIEHIIPVKIKTKRSKDQFGDWAAYLGNGSERKHPQYVSRIGNLTLLAAPLNIGASNNPFQNKRDAYRASSIAMTKKLASKRDFHFRDVDARSAAFARTAIELWPKP